MKRILITVFSVLLAFTACETVEEYTLTVETLPVEDILYNPATGKTVVTVKGRITGDETYVRERGFIWSKEDPFNTSIVTVKTNEPFETTFDNLEKNKAYYVKAYVRTTRGDFYGEYLPFKSISPIILENATDPDNDINGNFVTIRGRLVSDGGVTPSKYGARLSTSQSSAGTEYPASNLKDGMFSVDITPVDGNTDYYVEVFAENPLGEVKTGKMKVHTKTLELAEAEIAGFPDTKPQNITVMAKVISNGNDYSTRYGIKYGLAENALDKTVEATSIEEDSSYTILVDGLETGTTYYFAAYATNSTGTKISEVRSNATLRQCPPIVSTDDIVKEAGFTYDWARPSGKVVDEGGLTITEYGFYIGKDSTVVTKYPASGIQDLAFSCEITGLEQATRYFYTAYAVNSQGEARGEKFKSFYTGILDKDIYEKDANMQFKTNKLIYYMLDPIEVYIGSNKYELIVLDRNLGATKMATSMDFDYQAAGAYYKWGCFKVQLSADMAYLATQKGVNNALVPSVNGVLWNGYGDQEQNTDNAATSWKALYEADPPQAANPCPDGFHVGSKAEWLALVEATRATNAAAFSETFKMCICGEFSPTGQWNAITQFKVWTDDSHSTTPANPTADQFSSVTLTNTSNLARKRSLPVRCIKDY